MLSQYESKMEKTMESLAAEFSGIRAGRANPHILDKLRVDYYGVSSTIQQVANVTVPEARTLMITPWENSLIKEIEKAIMTKKQYFSDAYAYLGCAKILKDNVLIELNQGKNYSMNILEK